MYLKIMYFKLQMCLVAFIYTTVYFFRLVSPGFLLLPHFSRILFLAFGNFLGIL